MTLSLEDVQFFSAAERAVPIRQGIQGSGCVRVAAKRRFGFQRGEVPRRWDRWPPVASGILSR